MAFGVVVVCVVVFTFDVLSVAYSERCRMRRLPWQRLYFGFVTKRFSLSGIRTRVSDTTASTTLAGFLPVYKCRKSFSVLIFIWERRTLCALNVCRRRIGESQSCIHVTLKHRLQRHTRKKCVFIYYFVCFVLVFLNKMHCGKC